MYINVGMANREKRPKQERDDIHFTHIAIPTSFYPSPPRGPTQYPPADYLSIHHHPHNPQTDSITVKLNKCTTCTNTIIRRPCSVTIVMAPSSQSNNQKSLKLQSNASDQPNNQLQHQSLTCNYPTHPDLHNRLLLSHLFPHKKHYVSNMLHDALNRQKHLPLSTSFRASIMQHVHLELHYIDIIQH